jgi:hypothetical protein
MFFKVHGYFGKLFIPQVSPLCSEEINLNRFDLLDFRLKKLFFRGPLGGAVMRSPVFSYL